MSTNSPLQDETIDFRQLYRGGGDTPAPQDAAADSGSAAEAAEQDTAPGPASGGPAAPSAEQSQHLPPQHAQQPQQAPSGYQATAPLGQQFTQGLGQQPQQQLSPMLGQSQPLGYQGQGRPNGAPQAPSEGYRPPTASSPSPSGPSNYGAPQRPVGSGVPVPPSLFGSDDDEPDTHSSWGEDDSDSLGFTGGRHRKATMGWQGRANKWLKLSLDPGAKELAKDAERAKVRTAISTTKYVGVVSGKGGVGTTAFLQALGCTLSDIRRDIVYGIDGEFGGNLLARTLDRSRSTAPKSTSNILRWDPTSGENFDALFRVSPQGFSVVGNPDDTRDPQLTPEQFDEMLSRFTPQGPIRLIDMPDNRDSPLFDYLVRKLHAIVVVTTPEKDAVAKTQATLRDIHGRLERSPLIGSMLVVVNHRSPADPVLDEEALVAKFSQGDTHGTSNGAARVLFTGYDPYLAEGGPVDYSLLNKETRDRYVSIASALLSRISS